MPRKIKPKSKSRSKDQDKVRFLCPQELADGTVKWHWKPSPKYRTLGWTNLELTTDFEGSRALAIARNRELDAWELGARAEVATALPAAPVTFGEAKARFLTDSAFLDRRTKTRASYKSALGILERDWALNGRLMIRDIDRTIVMDLRNALVEDRRKHRTAALLRTLGVFLQWVEDKSIAGKNWINPARKLKVPGPKPRRKRILIEHLPALRASATALALPHVELILLLGFYTVQREGDLLRLTEFMVTRLDDMSGTARRALAGNDGSVVGLRKQQEKTDEWIAVPFVPELRAAVEMAIADRRSVGATCTNIVQRPGVDGVCHEWWIQRDFRKVRAHAIAAAREADDHDLVALFTGLQFRDMRRSGMCWMRDLGVTVPMIAAISGHSIEYTQRILDTYMPADPRAAAEGMAMALSRQLERDAADKLEEASGERQMY